MLTEIKNRGVEDVLMVVCDGLKGLSASVATVWPATIVRTCVVHLTRAGFCYAARAGLGRDLSGPRTGLSGARPLPRPRNASCSSTARFVGWCAPRSRSSRSTAVTAKAVRARGHFPGEQAALKCVYLAVMALDVTGKGRARWTQRWKAALNAFEIIFDGRLSAGRR